MPRSPSRPRASKKAPSTSRSTTTLRRSLIALVTAGLATLQVTHCSEQRTAPRTPAPPPVASAPRTPQAAPAAQAMVQTRFADCPQHFAVAPPQVPQAWPTLRELCFTDFAVLHSGQTRTPVVVAERLSRQSLAQAQGQKRTDRFYADARLPRAERAELADYKGSGYARGHMAPAGDMPSADGMAQSFSLANMVPQDPRNNSGVWSKIEQDTRRYVQRAAGDVYVLTGPVFDGASPTIGSNRVRVPTHLFKLVYDPATGRAWAHWVANRADAKAGAPISYDELERRTGMDLLPRVQPQ